MRRKKLLVIVGGGIFGAIPARFLSMVPAEDMHKIDMLSGCSIGGILAAGYASGKSFQEIDEVFQSRAGECFSKRWQSCINPLSNPTYKNSALDGVIASMIGDAVMGDVRKIYPQLDLVIPSLNLTDDKYKVWDNMTGQDDPVRLADIAGFTSAAPSYFSGREHDGRCYIDGGLIEVAPLLTAATALKGKRGVPFLGMDILMIGTGVEKNDGSMTAKRYNGLTIMGVATDVLVPYVTRSNEMATRYWGKNMGFGSFNYYNPLEIEGDLDDVDLIPDLIQRCDAHRDEFLEAWERFMDTEDQK